VGGIAGIFKFNGALAPLAPNIHAMAKNMKRRGPDDEGYMISGPNGSVPYGGLETQRSQLELPYLSYEPVKDRFDIQGSLFLASRRLAVVDLSVKSHQPMCVDGRRFWICFNGEIYNHASLRLSLEADGEAFVSDGDVEVALRAYVKWGPACLDKFNGMFAFAVWDEKERTLFCARDRLGIKPFYYARRDGAFVFASQIRTLIASALVPAEPDMLGLYYGMSFGMAPRPMTAFKGVSALRPGSWMKVFDDGSVHETRYWRIPVGQADPSMKAEQAEELLDEKLWKSVGMRLASEVQTATFMSGGVDSTLVASIASDIQSGIKAFSIQSRDSDPARIMNARANAEKRKMDHVVKTISDDDMLNSIDDVFRTDEEPFSDLDPMYFISRFVSADKTKVVLSGLGADELFAGYSYSARVGAFKLLNLLHPLFKTVGRPHPFARLGCLSSVTRPEEIPLAMRSFMSDSEKSVLFTDPALKGLDSMAMVRELYAGDNPSFSDPVESICYMDMTNLMANHHLHRADNWAMRFSVEARLPFLDHELVELAFRIPSSLKVREGKTKWILRKLASKYIPDQCLNMKGRGFPVPNGRLMKGPLDQLVYESLKKLCAREMFNPDAILRTFIEWKTGLRSHRGVWQLVATEMWMSKYFGKS